MKIVRKIVIAALLFIVLLCVIVLVMPDRYLKVLGINLVHFVTGYELDVGTLELVRSLNPQLLLSDVTLKSPVSARLDSLLEVDQFEVSVQLLPLLSGHLHLNSISSTELLLRLEKSKSETSPLQITPETFSWSMPRLSIDRVVARSTRIDYIDETKDVKKELFFESISYSHDESGPDPELRAIGVFDEQPISLTIALDTAGASQNANQDASVLQVNIVAKVQAAEVAAVALLTRKHDVVDLDLHSAQWVSESGQFHLSGTVLDILDTATVSIAVSGSTPDMSIVTHLFGQKMPPQWGPIEASAVLEGESGHYALNQLNATLSGKSNAHVIGNIGSLYPFDDMHLDVEADLSTLAEVSVFTRKPLPDIGHLTGSGIVRWQDGLLSLDDAYARHEGDSGTAVVTGKIGDLIHFDKVRLRADVDLPDFRVLELFTGIDMPPVDHVVASANLISATARDLSARQLTVTTTREDVTFVGKGSVESIFKNGAVLDLQISSEVAALSRLNDFLNASLPDFGSLSATARLTGAGQEIFLGDVEATIEDNLMSGTMRSEGGYVNRLEDIAYSVELETPSVAQLADSMGWVLGTISKPATLSTQVSLAGDMLQFKETRLNVDGNLIDGNVSLQNFNDSEKRKNWVGNINVVELDLIDVLDIQTDIENQPDVERGRHALASKKSVASKMLSDETLPLSVLRNDDVDISVHIEKLTTLLSDIADASFKVEARQGVMSVGGFTGKVNEGEATMSLNVDTTTQLPTVTLNASADNTNLARAGWFRNSDKIENTGGAWITLSLAGQGNSIAQIMANATGEGSVYVEDLLFKQHALSLLSSDLLTQLVEAINPLDEAPADTRFKCTALVFQIDEGQLSTPFGFAVESDTISVTGDASIDFVDELLNVEFSSKPKHGLGISLNLFTNLIKLTGSLSSPSLSVSQSGMLKSGVSLAAAIASNGVTLLAQGLYEKHQANSQVCTKALGH